MFKDVVVPIIGSPGDSSALKIAIEVAACFGAHLTVLEMVNLPPPTATPRALTPDLTTSEVHGALRSQAETNVAKLEAKLAQERIPTSVRMVESLGEPALLAAHHVRYADLAVVAGSSGDTAEAALTRAYFCSLLFESGRPVLVVPPRCTSAIPPRRVVVAWRPTREAARAVQDAMPFLQGAEAVDLLIGEVADGERGSNSRAAEDMEAHLARHGVNAKSVVRKTGGNAVGAMLLEHARQMHADLVVAGGYGHSRLREWAMGGVTRELLMGATKPVLYSH